MIIENMINIETTNICPANCIMCPREEFTAKLGIMNINLFKKIIDDCVTYNTKIIDLCGFGEAFSDSLLFERCKYVKEKLPDSKIYISTNAFLMNEKYFENIVKYIDILKLSIFGMSKESYRKLHKLSYDKCFSNIKNFLLYKKNKPYIIGLFIKMGENTHEMFNWIDYWEPLLDEVYVWTPHNWIDYINYRIVDKSNQLSCGRPFKTIYIHIDGTVSVCCLDINKRLTIGNIKNQTIKEILESDKLKEIQEKHKNNNFSNLICSNCDQTNYNPDNLVYSSNKNRKVGKFAFEI